jgi:hypothetical protein
MPGHTHIEYLSSNTCAAPMPYAGELPEAPRAKAQQWVQQRAVCSVTGLSACRVAHRDMRRSRVGCARRRWFRRLATCGVCNWHRRRRHGRRWHAEARRCKQPNFGAEWTAISTDQRDHRIEAIRTHNDRNNLRSAGM